MINVQFVFVCLNFACLCRSQRAWRKVRPRGLGHACTIHGLLRLLYRSSVGIETRLRRKRKGTTLKNRKQQGTIYLEARAPNCYKKVALFYFLSLSLYNILSRRKLSSSLFGFVCVGFTMYACVCVCVCLCSCVGVCLSG